MLRLISVCFRSAEFNAVEEPVEITNFPKTLKAACKAIGLGIKSNVFVQYVVCPKCSSVSDADYGSTIINYQKVSRQCPFIEYPSHVHVSRRTACGILN